ncbi:kinase-like domain-containing protein [Xylariaceae sp. FL0804]|nr:kinase-like domain-containing protein [Xylariaceae sp. FL0804]
MVPSSHRVYLDSLPRAMPSPDATLGASHTQVEEHFSRKASPDTFFGCSCAQGCSNVEELQHYFPEGHHPIHIYDILDGRYEVIAKLGAGGFATVWLCHDENSEQWRAVKVIQARASHEDNPELRFIESVRDDVAFCASEWDTAHIALPLEHFWLEGPNGRHLCEVLPVLGPSIDVRFGEYFQKLPLETFQRVFRQAAESLRFLHSKGIVHGDFRASNILMQLADISNITRDEMVDRLPEPIARRVWTYSGMDTGSMAPKYVVAPVDLSILGLTEKISVIDFGQSFRVNNPPSRMGIPMSYGAPEAVFHHSPGPDMDVWSLAITIMKVRVNRHLLADSLATYTKDLESILGPLPEYYRRAYVDNIIKQYGEDGPPDGFLSSLPFFPTGFDDRIRSLLAEEQVFYDLKAESEQDTEGEQENQKGEHADLGGAAEQKLFLRSMIGEEEVFDESESEDEDLVDREVAKYVEKVFKLSKEEVIHLGDLITRVVKYDPKERLGIDGLLNHEWFRMSCEASDMHPLTDDDAAEVDTVSRSTEQDEQINENDQGGDNERTRAIRPHQKARGREARRAR